MNKTIAIESGSSFNGNGRIEPCSLDRMGGVAADDIGSLVHADAYMGMDFRTIDYQAGINSGKTNCYKIAFAFIDLCKFQTAIYNIQLYVFRRRRKMISNVNTCLLYTSRCV